MKWKRRQEEEILKRKTEREKIFCWLWKFRGENARVSQLHTQNSLSSRTLETWELSSSQLRTFTNDFPNSRHDDNDDFFFAFVRHTLGRFAHSFSSLFSLILVGHEKKKVVSGTYSRSLKYLTGFCTFHTLYGYKLSPKRRTLKGKASKKCITCFW